MHYLLVQPKFPIPTKSVNHKGFLPVGLLKLASWLQADGNTVELVRGETEAEQTPDTVYITSLFTYWSAAVWTSVEHYKTMYPDAHVVVGGIYASLAPEHCKRSGCDEVQVGVHPEAEHHLPDYGLVDTDFQIVHASRGCIRRCSFCGTYKIEPRYTYKKSILGEIVRQHLVFYDNNLLANPHIEQLLTEISTAKHDGRKVTCECQSGFDGRLFTPELCRLLKAARFRNPRIAWDGSLDEATEIKRQIDLLVSAGYSPRDISVFMIYNFELGPVEMDAKANQCLEWGVQVADCRYRPLDAFADGYNPRLRNQGPEDYHIQAGWTDADVRGFRRLVRENNICIRYNIPRKQYSKQLEGMTTENRLRLMDELGIHADNLSREELKRLNERWIESQAAS